MQNRSGANKTDPWNDLGGNASVIAAVPAGKFVRKKRKHRRTNADKHVGPQPRGPMLRLALQPDQAAKKCGKQDFFYVATDLPSDEHWLCSELDRILTPRVLRALAPLRRIVNA